MRHMRRIDAIDGSLGVAPGKALAGSRSDTVRIRTSLVSTPDGSPVGLGRHRRRRLLRLRQPVGHSQHALSPQAMWRLVAQRLPGTGAFGTCGRLRGAPARRFPSRPYRWDAGDCGKVEPVWRGSQRVRVVARWDQSRSPACASQSALWECARPVANEALTSSLTRKVR